MDTEIEKQIMSAKSQSNPLLARARIPGETFALPSRGLLYKNDELDDSVKNGEVVVNPMVTLDEIYMRTPDMLLNGTAVTKVFEHCIPQVKKPLELFAKDMDYLLVCLRKVTYGDFYEGVFKHDCKEAKEHSYNIPLDPLLSKSKPISKNSLKKDYILTLPNGQVISLLPPRYYKVLMFYQTLGDTTASLEEMSQNLIDSIVGMIDNVDSITDTQYISEWLKELPAGYINKISDKIASAGKWGPDMSVEIECRDCGQPFEVTISLNPIDFFS